MKNAVVLLLAVLPIGALLAQKPYFGIKAGLNSSNLVVRDATNSQYKFGFNAGLLAHIHANKHFAIQPEIYYSEQGGKVTFPQTGEIRANVNYVNIPVMFQYMFGKGSRLQAGPQLGLLTDAKYKIGVGEQSVKDLYKSTDLSFAVGAGILTHSKVGIDVRWVFGLSNISKDQNATTRNNVGQLTLFYMFNHRGK